MENDSQKCTVAGFTKKCLWMGAESNTVREQGEDYDDFMCTSCVPLTGEYHSGWLWNPEAVCGDTRRL